jgi:hypothetical protein
MRRRAFIVGLGGAAAWPVVARGIGNWQVSLPAPNAPFVRLEILTAERP